MKESDYINATDLAKLRAAYTILGDVFPSDEGYPKERRFEIMASLSEWIEEVEARVKTEEEK